MGSALLTLVGLLLFAYLYRAPQPEEMPLLSEKRQKSVEESIISSVEQGLMNPPGKRLEEVSGYFDRNRKKKQHVPGRLKPENKCRHGQWKKKAEVLAFSALSFPEDYGWDKLTLFQGSPALILVSSSNMFLDKNILSKFLLNAVLKTQVTQTWE